MRDAIAFVFSVEEILDGLDRRIDGARQDLQTYRREHGDIISNPPHSPRAAKVIEYVRSGISERQRHVTELRRWKACFQRLTTTAQFRLTVDDCAFFDLPKPEPDYATGGVVTNTAPFLVGEGTHIHPPSRSGPR